MAEARKLNIEVAFKDSLTRPLTATEKNLARFGSFAKGTFNVLAKSVFNLKTALASLLAAYSVNAIAERSEAMLNLAEATGENVEAVSELAAVFGQNNVDFEAFESLVKNLAKAQRDAVAGASDVAAAFELVGVSVADLKELGAAQLFERIAAGLEQYDDKASQLFVLSRLLPKDAFKSITTLGKGVADLQEQIVRVRSLNATVTREQAAAAAAWNTALGEVRIAAEGVARQFIKTFGPEITAGLRGLADFIAQNSGAIVDLIKRAGSTALAVINGIVAAIIGLIRLVERFSGSLLDEGALSRERNQLKDTLELIDRYERQKANLPTDAGDISGTRMVAYEGGFTMTFKEIEEAAKRADELRARINAIDTEIGQGLAVTLEEQFRKIKDEFAATADSIRQNSERAGDAVKMAFAGAAAKTAVEDFGKTVGRVATNLGNAASTVANKLRSVFKAATEDQKKLASKVDETNKRLEATQRVIQQTAETPNTVADGFSKRMEGLTDQAQNFARTVGEGFADLALSGIDRFADAIANVVTGTMSAKEAFKEFAKAVLADVARMIAKFIALGVVKTIFGLEDGGVMPGGVTETMPVKAYAKGGIARRPQLALFGEGRTAEAFVPLPDNRSIPVTFTGNQDNGGVVNVNITAMDSKDVTRVLSEQQGLLKTLWINQSERNVQMRQSVRKAAS